ncbi:MAG: EF2563 family selenium-dependent molybdenum hydroxylase system protein [Candidatus Marinimicrobia bacterium]|nr:EF2563 family selenium-dependent molybdenum hydroxylase system protein [Candidatus Neomarinimicrobiota bacterium]
MFEKHLIWVRGAGELGSAIVHLIFRLGFRVFVSEIIPPLAIRRPVTFSDAILLGSTDVEGVVGKYDTEVKLPEKYPWPHVPIFQDIPTLLKELRPSIIIDARMKKIYAEDFRPWAGLVIGLGPGFHTEKNCHLVIETMRGHDLARIISHGGPKKDTGVPGNVGGETSKRIIRAPRAGRINWRVDFGDLVTAHEILGNMDDGAPLYSPLQGMVRGLISPETPVIKNMKIGDIDPRGAEVKYLQISDKARSIAAGVLEAILLHSKDR